MPRRTGKESLYPRVRESLKRKQEHNRALAKANDMRYDRRPTVEHLNPQDFNYGAQHTPTPDVKVIQEINEYVADALEKREEVADLKDKLKKAEAELVEITEKTIPELMKRCGLSMLRTPAGLYVELDTKLWAKIPTVTAITNERDPEKRSALIQRREAAIKWLEDNEHSNLIKREFVVQFEKGDEKWAQKFRADLAKRKNPLHVTEGEDVNAQSLSALLRQLREEKIGFPEDVLGVYEKFTAKISK